jgi:catechol 2,3-dioxygenase-like lactoylglutathione lyase family enzyme
MADSGSIAAFLKDYIVDSVHVGFVVPNLDEAVANARRVYGLDEQAFRYEPPPGVEAPTRFAFFTVGGLEFEYIEPTAEPFRKMLLDAPSGGAGINHVAWQVSDIDGAVAALAERGIRPGHVTPGGVISIGPKRMVYLDPATTGGLVIELLEYPEDSKGD